MGARTVEAAVWGKCLGDDAVCLHFRDIGRVAVLGGSTVGIQDRLRVRLRRKRERTN